MFANAAFLYAIAAAPRTIDDVLTYQEPSRSATELHVSHAHAGGTETHDAGTA